MQTKGPWIDRNCAAITAGIVAVIVYGSLYPFAFYGNDVVGGAIRALLSTWRTSPDRYDLIANILFYMPFGFFAVRSVMRPSLAVRVGLVLMSGIALSSTMELLQVYDAGRQTSMSDVYANFAGTLLGAATSAGLAHRLRIPELRALGNRPFVPLLLLCWLGNRLFPYVPAGDLQKYWRALQPLVIVPTFPPVDVYKHVARLLSVAMLLEAQCGIRTARLAFAPVVVGVLFSRVLINGIRLSPAEVAGGFLAVLVWAVYLSRLRSRAVVVALLFAGSVLLVDLAPYRFGGAVRQFQWIPFFSLLEGSFYIAVPSFFEKVFTGGSLVWLMVRAGLPWAVATLTVIGLVMAIGIGQTHLPGRAPETTDMVVVALTAMAMKFTEEPHLALRRD